MTGIIEQIAADVAAIKAQLSAMAGTGQTLAPQAQTLAQAQPQPQAANGGLGVLGGAPAAPQGYPPATAEQIVTLITPHTGDPNLKAALQAEMAAMGIGALPDARADQYGELHYRFQQVIARFQQQQAQPVAAPASII